MTPRQHIDQHHSILSRASLRDCGCSPAVITAILAAAQNPQQSREHLHHRLAASRTTADHAALLGAMAVLRSIKDQTLLVAVGDWAASQGLALQSDRRGHLRLVSRTRSVVAQPEVAAETE